MHVRTDFLLNISDWACNDVTAIRALREDEGGYSSGARATGDGRTDCECRLLVLCRRQRLRQQLHGSHNQYQKQVYSRAIPRPAHQYLSRPAPGMYSKLPCPGFINAGIYYSNQVEIKSTLLHNYVSLVSCVSFAQKPSISSLL